MFLLLLGTISSGFADPVASDVPAKDGKSPARNQVNPNLLVDVSRNFVLNGISQTINQVNPFCREVRNIPVRGTIRINARLEPVLVSDPNQGDVDLVVNGTVTAQVLAYPGPLIVAGLADVPFQGHKRVLMQPGGFQEGPPASLACGQIFLVDAETRFRGPLLNAAGKLVVRRVYRKRRASAEEMLSRRVEQQINQQLEQRAAQVIANANQSYREKFLDPLVQNGLSPTELRYRTTPDHIYGEAGLARGKQQGGVGKPPELIDQPDLAVRLHESFVNNAADNLFAGQTFTDVDMAQRVARFMGPLGRNIPTKREEVPWTVTFARENPVAIAFANHGFALTIKGTQFTQGEEIYPIPMNITARYQIQKTTTGVKAVRQGEVEVRPPGFKPGSEKDMDVRQQILAVQLEDRFSRMLSEQMVIEKLPLPERMTREGPYLTTQADAVQGWLVLAWKQEKMTR
ncbi:MAG: hypothetical protein JO112_17005 [Planctomycetes bacterium]|nr:hypothetical protein [Planctomycetota bacterium]